MTDSSPAGTERTAGRRAPLATFGRDVGVNVLANLIAAAIIYLLGVLAGLLPRSPQLLVAASLVVLSSLTFALGTVLIPRIGDHRWRRAVRTLMIIFPFACGFAVSLLPIGLGWQFGFSVLAMVVTLAALNALGSLDR